ncbi:MAG: hypothetical protein LKJ90_05160 [Faecalibacterium sp.]|jgi:hypothetical protein|nr:hypothetical protein [Faecalibacterium sp.]
MNADLRKTFLWLPVLVVLAVCCPGVLVLSFSCVRFFVPAVLVLIVLMLAACITAAVWTQRQKLPAAAAPDALPAYANTETYADTAATFYPEPKGYTEPPRQAPVISRKKPILAFFALLFGVLGLLYGIFAFLPGVLAIAISLVSCRETINGKKVWNPSCRRCAQAAVVFGAAACIENFLFLFL